MAPFAILAVTIKPEEVVCLKDPQEVLDEVRDLVFLMFPQFDFQPVEKVFHDIVDLFHGRHPGYRKCTTRYHNLNHTTDCFLVMARILHGAFLNGVILNERNLALGLIAALLHDTGYIQAQGDDSGTGGKYTLVHVERSIEFMERYLRAQGYSGADLQTCSNFLRSTGLEVKPEEIHFESWEQEMLGRTLETADLLGQMADENYLERLPFLYCEFQEGGVLGFQDELDLLKKTPQFWEVCQLRIGPELENVGRYLRDHFWHRWGIDQDLYRQAIDQNIKCLELILASHESDYQKYLGKEGLQEISRKFQK
jgi:hypothetical protein